MILEMIVVLVVIGAVALITKKVTIAQMMAEVTKLEGEGSVEIAKIKALIAKL